jgi:hypothetical protein
VIVSGGAGPGAGNFGQDGVKALGVLQGPVPLPEPSTWLLLAQGSSYR